LVWIFKIDFFEIFDYRDIRLALRRGMYSWQELQRLHSDWVKIHKGAIDKRRALLDSASFMDRWLFINAIQTVRTGRMRLVTNCAYGFADQLYLDASVAATPHLDRLLDLALKPGPDGQPDPQRWFEGISLFDQAIAITKIEKEEPLERIGRVLDMFVDLLEREIFTGEFNKIDFYAYHDPEQEFVVARENVGIGKHLTRPGLQRRKSRLACRQVQKGSIAYMHHRIKDPFLTWLKMQRQCKLARKEDVFSINDRCGLTKVVPTQQDVLALWGSIRRLVVVSGGTITQELRANYNIGEPLDEENGSSSSKYRFAQACFVWQGVEIELQFMTFHDYFTSLRSLSEANHELYKIRQAYNHTFPLIWPVQIYEVNWSNPYVRHQMSAWKQAQLGWRVNGDSSERSS